MVCLGLEPWGGRMEGADESNELWPHPFLVECLNCISFLSNFRSRSEADDRKWKRINLRQSRDLRRQPRPIAVQPSPPWPLSLHISSSQLKDSIFIFSYYLYCVWRVSKFSRNLDFTTFVLTEERKEERKKDKIALIWKFSSL